MTIINVNNLVKNYETKEAVKNISFSINEGEVVALIGPNGAGKTTTIKILTGILHPTSGNAQVCGIIPWEKRMKLGYNIGCLFGQKSQLNQALSVIDSYILLGAIYDIDKEELMKRIDEYATYFGVKKLITKKASSLSLGERMVCEIVGAILHKPKILFLDEPTIGLDIVTKQQVRDLILKLNKQYGTTVILTSHDMGDVEYLCKKIIIVNHGEIVLNEDINTLRTTFLTKMILDVNFDKDIENDFHFKIMGATNMSVKGDECKLEIDTKITSINSIINQLSSYGKIIKLESSSDSLENIISQKFREMKGVTT